MPTMNANVGHGMRPSGDWYRYCHHGPARKWGYTHPNAHSAAPETTSHGRPQTRGIRGNKAAARTSAAPLAANARVLTGFPAHHANAATENQGSVSATATRRCVARRTTSAAINSAAAPCQAIATLVHSPAIMVKP